MFDNTDPQHLQQRLEAFIEHWHGHRRPWYGIAAEKVHQARLPGPLRWLYGFAGEWPSRSYWDTLFGNQDLLLPFESLRVSDGKLVFVVENQGVWQVGTEAEGDNPPVFVRIDEEPWRLLCDSLTTFLVTFVLHETVFGCAHLQHIEDIRGALDAAGLYVAPLWLERPYPICDGNSASRPVSFHLASGPLECIVMDNWVATNADAPWDALPSLFRRQEPRTRGSGSGFDWCTPFPDHLKIPALIRRNQLQNLVSKHEQEIAYHQQRCLLYRNMMQHLQNDDI